MVLSRFPEVPDMKLKWPDRGEERHSNGVSEIEISIEENDEQK